MSTNPFLIDSSCAQPSSSAPTFNPFAAFTTDTTDSSAASNPFLHAFGSTGTDDISGNNDATFMQSANVANPFAQFFSAGDLNVSVQATSEPVVADNFLLDNDYSSTTTVPVENSTSSWAEPSSMATAPPGPPRRPPPPRPSVAKETKDLILSVTGALEATSSDLLDRLQATRTPSPTPLRELNSPSPTAMYEVNDLLGDDDIAPPPPSNRHGAGIGPSSNIQQEASDIFDAIANLAKSEAHSSVVTTTPTIPFSAVSTSTAAPVPPPSRPPPPQLPIQGIETDLSSLLDSRLAMNRTANVPASNSMIDSHLTAGGSRSKTELGVYTATRKASHDITATRLQPIPARKKYSLDYSATSSGGAPLVDTEALRLVTAPSPVMEDAALSIASSSPITEFPAAVPPPLTMQSSPQPVTRSPSPPLPPPPPVVERGRNDGGEILETAKFPVMSTTPLMSYENIANENLYEDAEIVPAPAPPMPALDVFASSTSVPASAFNDDPFATAPLPASNLTFAAAPVTVDVSADFSVSSTAGGDDAFDDFDQKFRNFSKTDGNTVIAADPFDPFSGTGISTAANGENNLEGAETGFGNEAPFDEFLAMSEPPAASFGADNSFGNSWPSQAEDAYSAAPAESGIPPFISSVPQSAPSDFFPNVIPTKMAKTDSSETPPTPLFDEDVSQPLEPFPRTTYTGLGWEMQIRYPIRKKFTGQRFWKKVFVKLSYQGETPHLELVNKDDGKETLLHEWPLQPCYVISDIGAQQYDQFGKIFTVKIQFVVYKERPGVRPGQVTKAERLTNKLSQFAAYAIQGDYQGVKEFGSDLKKLGLPVEHSPQISLICKLGSHNYEDMKQFSVCVEDALFRLGAHRDNIHITYKMEEVQITAVDELYVEQNTYGSVTKQIARVRLFFLGFLTGMPDIDIGVNDLRRQGKEIVGRHDIIPVVTEEWIRLENVEFHSCIQQDVYEDTKTIRLKPPDACYLELMRFRVRPPKNRELPLQLKTVFRICGNKVDITADIMVPGFTSRKLGQIPCEDVAVRIPIPECWIYLFRVEKHFRYGSVKSAHRRTGKIKGIERFLGAVDTLDTHLIEVTSGHAKYEHHHRSIVWRMPRLPKEGQGAYTNHNLVCHLALTSYDQVPDELAKYCYVEFTMPITQVSHTTVRSVSISNSDSDSPPEKYVRHLARHEYRVEIEQTHAESTNDYIAATITKPSAQPKAPAPAPQPPPPRPAPDSNSDSD